MSVKSKRKRKRFRQRSGGWCEGQDDDVKLIIAPDSYRTAILMMMIEWMPTRVTPAHVAEIESVKSELGSNGALVLQLVARQSVPRMMGVMIGRFPDVDEDFDVVRFRDELAGITDEGTHLD